MDEDICLARALTADERMVVNQDVAGFSDFFAEADWRRHKRRRAANYMERMRLRSDDDGIDRLHHNYTVVFLVLFASLVSTKQYAGDPIACWIPARFSEMQELYTDQVCWISNTYYDDLKDVEVPDENSRDFIRYYQWIPILLWAQAFLFYSPCVIWRMLARRSGISVRTLMEIVQQVETRIYEKRCTCDFCYLILYLHSYLGPRRPPKRGCWSRLKVAIRRRCMFIPHTDDGNYLTVVYLFIKLIYIVNCVGQLFFMNLFLDTDYHLFGVHIIRNLWGNRHWKASLRFPRLTLCDFEIRELANVHKHTVQCVLPINLFNEKIYVFIWFWFVFIGSLTVVNTILWTAQYLDRAGQQEYVRRQLVGVGRRGQEAESLLQQFTCQYLRADGVFLVRLVGRRAGDVIAGELLAGLWDKFREDCGHVGEELANPENWQPLDEYVLAAPVVMDVCRTYHAAIDDIIV